MTEKRAHYVLLENLELLPKNLYLYNKVDKKKNEANKPLPPQTSKKKKVQNYW